MIAVRNLTMRLSAGGHSVTILDDVTAEVPEKQRVSITGPSGSRAPRRGRLTRSAISLSGPTVRWRTAARGGGQGVCLPSADPPGGRTHRESRFRRRPPGDRPHPFPASGSREHARAGDSRSGPGHLRGTDHHAARRADCIRRTGYRRTKGRGLRTSISGRAAMTSFPLRMAWRETRAAWRHFLYFFLCIALGVGGLVGVALFASNVERTVTREARGSMAGDLEIRLSRPMSHGGESAVKSRVDRGIASTHV